MVGLYADELEEVFQQYYQKLVSYRARLPYPNFVNCSKFLNFRSNRSLLFIDGWSLIEEEDFVHGLEEEGILVGVPHGQIIISTLEILHHSIKLANRKKTSTGAADAVRTTKDPWECIVFFIFVPLVPQDH